MNIFCTRSYSAGDLQRKFGLDINLLCDDRHQAPSRVVSMVPYRLNNTNDRDRGSRTHSVLTRDSARPIVQMSQAYGSENLRAMSGMFGHLREQLTGEDSTALMGATTDAYAKRSESFVKAVRYYQDALLKLGEELKTKSANVAAARENAQKAYTYLQERFQAELSQIKFNGGSRGTPFSSFDRGVNIVKDSRIVRLRLDSTVEGIKLVNFTRYANFLGNGLAVIDLGSRAGNIWQTREGGGDWYRELFKESLSFGGSAWLSSQVALAGVAGLGLLIAATPVGWAAIVVGVTGGLAVVGFSAIAGYASNKFLKNNADDLFDITQGWVQRLVN